MTSEQAEKCPRYANCEAPLCPLDLDAKQAWYADEDVCKNKEYRELPWIAAQLKLKGRKTKDLDKAYTHSDLQKLGI
jgi:hypothetical protein